jgi:polysaccharide pyruvyl transferase WcaK-like protein
MEHIVRKQISVGILYGSLFNGNMGCNALTYSAIDILEQVAKVLNLEVNYILSENSITGNSFISDDLGIDNVQVVKSFYKSFKNLTKSLLLRQLGLAIKERSILNALDICFCTTSGDSFSDIYGPRFYSIAKTIEYPIKKGKPLIMLPQTFGPFKCEKARKKAVQVLEKTSAVFTRDSLSTELVGKLVSNIRLYESVDMALFMRYTKQTLNTNKIRVGINPSGLLWNGGYTQNNQFDLRESYPDIIRRILEYFLGFSNVQIELIGHVLAGPYYNPIEDDYRVCKLLKKEYPDCVIAPYFYTPIEAKSYISGLDFLAGSRMHCCIAAYSSGIPVFPLGYSRKFSGLFKNGLGYIYMSDLTEDDKGSVINKLDEAYQNRNNILNEMPERLAVIDKHREVLITNLSQLMSSLLNI